MFNVKSMFFLKKKIPSCFQRDSRDCGIVCLQSIIGYHGLSIELETLRKLSFMSNSGTSLLDLKMAGSALHINPKCYELTISALVESFNEPCILHWNQNHYVVLYRIKKKSDKYIFYILDPSIGKIKLDQTTFEKAWLNIPKQNEDSYSLGVALFLSPEPPFYKLKGETINNKIEFGRIKQYFSQYKKAIIYIILCILGVNAAQFTLPFLTQNIVDIGIHYSDKDFIKLILISQALIYLSSSCFDFVRRWLLLHVNSRANIMMISDFLYKLVKLPIRFFDNKVIGDLLQRINDQTKIETFLTSVMTDLLFSISTLLMFSIVLLLYSIKLFIIFIVFSILYLLWIYIFLEKRKQIDYSRFIQLSANSSNLIEFIEGMKDIKLFKSHNKKRWDWETIQLKLFKINTDSLVIEQYQNVGSLLINQIKNITLTYMSATMVIENEISLGMMLSIQFIIGQLEGPINKVIDYMHSWQDARISFDRMAEIHMIENEDVGNKAVLHSNENFNIEFKNVYFRYGGNGSPLVLNNITFNIPTGKTTAIVGMSGSGKTTLIKLLLGFYPPSSGTILIGNHDITTINIQSWRDRCSVIMQDSYIFNDTIVNNINLTENETDLNKIEFASKCANFSPVVDSLPSKYQTRIGLDGHGLSKGQMQRLLIARAIYKDSDYIIFDEFTNSLDAQNESDIMYKLGKYKTNKTAIIIAHRFSTIKNADQIIVVDNGEIREIGCHEELIKNSGIYYNLMKEQLNLN